jgi:nucleotide-binding universal stress UspA family protein
MHKRILVAVDGSSTGNAALAEALALAKAEQAQVRVVHVVDSPYLYPDALYGSVAADLEAIRRAWRQAGQTVIDQAVAAARHAGTAPESGLVESDGQRLSGVIVDEARRWGADLIVVGTHGRRGLERVLLGSVAEGVARSAPVSVLLVRPAPEG